MVDYRRFPAAQPDDIVFDPRDDREPVAETLKAPYSSICRIDVFVEGVEQPVARGTGWIVNPITVITAGHLVYHRAYAKTGAPSYANSYAVYPAFSEPDGVAARFTSVSATAHEVFRSTQSVDFDIAVLRLSGSLTVSFPPLSYFPVEDIHLINQQGYVAGFSSDRESGKKMLVAEGRIVGADEQRLMHQIDTVEGQSGAPLWVLDSNGGVLVTGVHVQGFRARPINTAVRINSVIAEWVDQQMLGSR